MAKRDYYEVLGLGKDASADEIKKWESEHQGSYLYLEPNEAYELGQLKNRTQYTHHYV